MIPGTFQVTAKIAPSSTSDTYATHTEEYGQGGYRTVASTVERDAISADRRKTGMIVYVEGDQEYRLESDLLTWTPMPAPPSTADIMLKSVYDVNDDGVVDNSERLGGQLPAWFLDLANMTGSLPQANVTGLVAALASLISQSEKGAALGVCPLNGAGQIDPAYISITGFNYKGVWDANTNTPAIAGGVGVLGDFYWVSVPGATVIDGSGPWVVGQAIIFDGVVWQQSWIATGVTSWNGLTGAINATTADLPAVAGFRYLTEDQYDALALAPASAANRVATMSDITASAAGMQSVNYFWDLKSSTTYSSVVVMSYDANSPDGCGIFRWVSASNIGITDIPGMRIKPNATTSGYWVRQFAGAIQIDWFGVNGSASTLSALGINQATANARYGTGWVDVTTDTYDFAAIKTAFRTSETLGYGAIEFTNREYKINKGVKLPRYFVNSSGVRQYPSYFDIDGKGCTIQTTPSYVPTQSISATATYNGSSTVVVAGVSDVGAICIGNTATGVFGTAQVTNVTSIGPSDTTIVLNTTVPAGSSTITITAPVAMFDRVPPTQNYALNVSGGYIGCRFNIKNFHLENTVATWGGSHYGIRLGPSYGSQIIGNQLTNFNRSIYLEFCLNADVRMNQGNYLEYFTYMDYGSQWGGSNSNSQDNVTTLQKNQAYGTGTREVYDLTFTAPAGSGGNITVTLDSIAYVIPISPGTTSAVATEIYNNNSNPANAKYEYFGSYYNNPPDLQGWSVTNPAAGVVRFTAKTGGNKTGTFTYSAGATGATATLALNTNGTDCSIAAFYMRGSSGIVMDNNIIEGEYPWYGIYFDSDGSTVVHDFVINNTHIETSCSLAAIYIRSTGGNYTINGVFNQYEHKNFLAFENLSGYPELSIDGIYSQIPLYYAINDNGVQMTTKRVRAGSGPQTGAVSITGTLTSGSNVITAVSSTTNVTIGDRVCDYLTNGANHYVPMGAIVSNKTGNSITMTYKNGSPALATGSAAGRNIYVQNPTTGNFSHVYCPLIYRRGLWNGIQWQQPRPIFIATSTPGTISSAQSNYRLFNIPAGTEALNSNPYSGI